MVFTGLREPRGPWGEGRRADAADAFEAVRIIAAASGIEVALRAAQYLPWHPGRCAEVLVGEVVVGHAGQLHPAVIERSGLPKGTCAVELNLDALPIVDLLPAPRVSPFPAVFQDVNLVVGADVAAQTVAIRLNNQQITPEHILKALLEDEQGMASPPRQHQATGCAECREDDAFRE